MISSLLHLVGLRPRVYYTLTNFRGGGGQGPLGPPPLNTPMGCHINNTDMGALFYVDDIILPCSSTRELNHIIKMCSFFANSNHITVNCKKTVCIKFGGKTHNIIVLKPGNTMI